MTDFRRNQVRNGAIFVRSLGDRDENIASFGALESIDNRSVDGRLIHDTIGLNPGELISISS